MREELKIEIDNFVSFFYDQLISIINSKFTVNSNNNNFTILLIIPYLSVRASVLLSQQIGIIAYIGKYCSKELQPIFNEFSCILDKLQIVIKQKL